MKPVLKERGQVVALVRNIRKTLQQQAGKKPGEVGEPYVSLDGVLGLFDALIDGIVKGAHNELPSAFE